MPTFPLHARPSLSYHESPRSFGARRDGKRKHAACDLYASAGTPILACLDGKVTRGPYLFYDVVYAIEVQHADGSVIRYGEIAERGHHGPAALYGDVVKEGQVIAYVGRMQSVKDSMLHFEMYTGVEPGPGQHGGAGGGKWLAMLTDTQRPPFMRRADLLNPTAFLDACTLAYQFPIGV